MTELDVANLLMAQFLAGEITEEEFKAALKTIVTNVMTEPSPKNKKPASPKK